MPGTDRAGRRRRTTDPEAQAQAAQARQDRLEALHQQLADGVAAITDGPAWRAWLDLAGRFHHYSFGNQLLIAAQRPDATHVAGYRAWQALGRQVRKGETAIWVLAPIQRRTTTPDTNNDTAADAPDPSADRVDRAGQSGRRIVAWTGAAVFDVSQTDGDPIPTPPTVQLLAGQAPDGLWDSLEQAITSRGFTVARCVDADAIRGANGLTDLLTRTVTIRSDVSGAQAVKSLAHEAGHVLLHTPDLADTAMPECLDLVEVEAESVAYLVAAHHGLDTADYTFGYIAGWAGRDTTAVQATAQRVLNATRTLLAHTDPDTEPTAPEDLAQHATTAATTSVALAEHAARTSNKAAPATPTAADAISSPGTGRQMATATPLADVNRSASSSTKVPPVGESGSLGAAHEADPTRRVLIAAQAWFLDQAATDSRYAAAVTTRSHQAGACRRDGIGWAPPTWTGLVDHLRDLGHTPEQILDSGVALLTRGRLIDRFRGRITFPVHDPHGVVGWTARDALHRPDTPKYLNTPTTELYDKSQRLFGTPGLADAHTVVLLEGPWDAYTVTHVGGPHVIGLATCGTAVTADQIRLATSTNARLVLGVDNDQPGLTALRRTLTLTRDLGMPHPNAVRASSGKDLADQYAAGGPAAVISDLDRAQPAGLVHADLHLALHPIGDTPEARVAAARAATSQADGLTIGDRGRLAHMLITRVGLTPEAAIEIAMPRPTPAASRAKPCAGPVTIPVRPAAAAR